jgi:cytochrome c-type biogenesis protein CcmE
MKVKLIVAGSTIALAAALLAVAGARDGWVYFLTVDQFKESSNYHTQRVRLHGKVGAEELEVYASLLSAKFELRGATQSIRVDYSGVIPEMLQAESDVVVEGKLADNGVFRADTLMTKCASKYETADGQAPHADPHSKEAAQ